MKVFSKLPYLKKDFLWAIGIVVFLILVGSPRFSHAGINNVLFVIFAILAWRKFKGASNMFKFSLAVGRIASLLCVLQGIVAIIIIVIIAFSISNIFLNLLTFFLYSLQYYVYSIWSNDFVFSKYKNLILLEIIGFFVVFAVYRLVLMGI